MEVIEISNISFIINLSDDEVQHYKLSEITDETDIKQSYTRIIEEEKLDKSFLSGALVQIFDSRHGGLQMFVTKLDSISDKKHNMDRIERSLYIYRLENVSSLLQLCKMLQRLKIENTSAYYAPDSEYIFLTSEKDLEHIGEFNAFLQKPETFSYIKEHCTLITHNAADTLAPLY